MSTRSKAPKGQKAAQRLSKMTSFQELGNLIRDAKRILISTHELPDGDGLGAEYALYHYLKRSKKSVRIYNPDPLPRRYDFLDKKRQVLLGPGEVQLWDSWDLWVIVDANDPKRVGPLWPELNMRSRKIVFLDHHLAQAKTDAGPLYPPHALLVSDIESSSIGELLFHLFEHLQLTKINKDVGLGLYVSVMTDTNSFRYARTTPESHRIAALTIEQGVNPEQVYQAIYSSKEMTHLKLLGHLLQNVKIAADGKLAWFEMDLELRRNHRASADDTQSFLNLLLLLRDAEVVCLFREEDDGRIRVSMKSKGQVRIHKVASSLGGGGHEFAAGTILTRSMPGAVEAVTQNLISLFDEPL